MNECELPESVCFDPSGDFAAFLQGVPAKWVVYLMSDAAGAPFQLLGVKNLRASLANRLCEHPADERTRSIPYRQVVRKIAWRRVDSQAEADWVYAQLAQKLFPAAYATLIENWSAWYIEIDPAAAFPRYVLTNRPRWELSRTTFGPIATKAQAQKLIEIIEDAFDLCRYHQILVQAPHGQACAYKQMHKCPAPCDGTVSVEMYHQQIQYSLSAISDERLIAQHEERMQIAAAALQFELAGKIKAYATQLRTLAPLRTIAQQRQVAVLRGSKAKRYRLMLLTPECVELSDEFSNVAEAAATIADYAERCEAMRRWDDAAIGRLAFMARQLLSRNNDAVLSAPEVGTISTAIASLARRKAEAEPQDEGVVQETGGA